MNTKTIRLVYGDRRMRTISNRNENIDSRCLLSVKELRKRLITWWISNWEDKSRQRWFIIIIMISFFPLFIWKQCVWWSSNWFSFGNQLLDHKHINLISTILSSAMNTAMDYGRCGHDVLNRPENSLKWFSSFSFGAFHSVVKMFVIKFFFVFFFFQFYLSVSSSIAVVCVRDSIEKCAIGSSASGTIMRKFSLIFQFKHCADGGAGCWLLVPSICYFLSRRPFHFFGVYFSYFRFIPFTN